MNIKEIIQATINYAIECAEKFGGKKSESIDDPRDFVFRDNTGETSLNQGGAYFGFILGNEEFSGRYHDLSLVFFPPVSESESWLMALGVGTMGFQNDYELASLPGTRRRFINLLSKNGYAKTELIDIEKDLPKAFKDRLPHLRETVKTYGRLLPICEIIDDPTSKDGKERICGFIAAYAELRNWATNATQRKAIESSIAKISNTKNINEEGEIYELLKQRRYVVLQGAPGTGKTFLANKIASKNFEQQFFTQFHAETTYSDFIYGIYPSVDQTNVVYEGKIGIFLESLYYAKNNPNKKVILIIDEINRANLSNVLGPIFYLFEYGEKNRTVEFQISDGLDPIKEIPNNLFVLATMNTADRSLAVIDFALRRRFAWYTVYPSPLNIDDLSSGSKFFEDVFNGMHSIFQRYATNHELVFEPGHSYYLANNEEEMLNRLKYEILPLIKEYLAEGILTSAQDEFLYYFQTHLGDEIFQLWI